MSSRVFVALRVKAPPERAFEAFTREIGAWWTPNSLFQTTPRAPGLLAFEPGEGGRLTETLANGKVFEIGVVTAWEPPSRLAFTWRQANFPPDLHTEVEVTSTPSAMKPESASRTAALTGCRRGRPATGSPISCC